MHINWKLIGTIVSGATAILGLVSDHAAKINTNNVIKKEVAREVAKQLTEMKRDS